MHAVIMAGGKGTRLAEITKGEIPKPMAPVLGKPLLLWQTDRLKEAGITRVTMIVGHLREKIMEYFGDGSSFGLEVDYIEASVSEPFAQGFGRRHGDTGKLRRPHGLSRIEMITPPGEKGRHGTHKQSNQNLEEHICSRVHIHAEN